LPLTLPAKFIRQRPDVRGAEANMHAAAAQIGVALAARLPNITLSANPGFSTFNLAQQFAPGSGFYVLAGSVAHTIFDGNALLNKQKAAEASFAQAEALYRQAVVSAFQNVADALRALQADTKAVNAADYTEGAASENLVIVEEKVRSGSFSQFELLNAQQAYLNARIATVQAEGNRLSDVVALFMALGGGWKDENLRDLPPTGPTEPTTPRLEEIQTPMNTSLLPRFLD
jgi:outer membrane protein TolC